MQGIIDWITANSDAIITGLLGLVAFASVIANFTATDADNKAVGWFSKVVNWLALNIKKPTPPAA